MGTEKLSWVLLLMLVWTKGTLQYSCRESEDCSCIQMPGEEYEMRCPKDSDSTFIIEVKSREFATVKCNMDPPWTDFKIQPTLPIEEVEWFRFQQCLLPNLTLREITQRIGVQPTNKLRFESYKSLNSTFERRHLSGFPGLERLSLNSNGLRNLPADLLMDLPELNALELRDNNLVLPVEFFEPVPKLRTLELGYNRMTYIDPKLFESLGKLNFLGLWGNELTSFEEHTFDNLTALSTLEISRNKLTTLPQDIFKPLRNLSTLQMASNKFSTLPEELLSQNLNLTSFGFNFNYGNLSTLPSRFLSNLPKLKEVRLLYNKLTVLPEDIFWGSSSLKNISLRGNALSTLPKNIFNESKDLGTLDISSNKLNSLPDGIFRAMYKLEKLEMQKNNLTSISKDLFLGLTGLKILNLENNGISSVHPKGFYPLRALEIANLSHNQITFEESLTVNAEFGQNSPIAQCFELRELDLSSNNITVIFPDWIFILTKLQSLDLKYNQISFLLAMDFQFLSQNIRVDIRHNNIRGIHLKDAELIADTQALSSSRNVQVLVEENPIICDCYMYDFLSYLNGGMHPNVQKLVHIIPDQLKCAGPESMDHILVSDLKPETFTCYNDNCPEKCECWSRPDDYTIIANCSYKNFTTAPERIVTDSMKGLKVVLDLTGNFLTEMPLLNQSGNANITEMFLSHNNISRISPDAIYPSLETLELHNNNLVRLDSKVVEILKTSTSLKELTIHGNPWKCDCEASDLVSFVQTKFKKIPHVLNVTCEGSRQPLSKMTANDLCPVATGMIVGVSFGIALLGLLIGTLAALYYRYQVEVKVWLFAHQMFLWFVTEEELDKDKLYDAFISYSHKDEDFVVNKLVPKLEEEPKPFKLCLHFRDWMPGEWIPTQIARSVEDSRRTIVVLSPNFLESVWGRMEFRAAHSQALSEGRARVIVVLFGDIGPTDNLDPELQAYLNMNTYVEWGDPWFWDKLRYALPHPPQVKKNNAKKIFDSHQHHIQLNGDKNGLIRSYGIPATPPAVTTPPADTLKTFTSNGSIEKGVLITDCLKNGMINYDSSDPKINQTPNKNENDMNIINGQCTPV